MISQKLQQQVKAYSKHPYPCVIIDCQGDIKNGRETAQTLGAQLAKPFNITTIAPLKGKKTISVDQSRKLSQKVNLKTHSENSRVFIVDHIGLAGREAQNALLKTIEQLQPNTYILIIAINARDALETIRSRSNILALDTLGNDNDYEISTNPDNLIAHAIVGSNYTGEISRQSIEEAARFMRLSPAERLKNYSKLTDDRDAMLLLLNSLRILCIATMRSSKNIASAKAWSNKVDIANDIIASEQSHASAKLLLLGAATRL